MDRGERHEAAVDRLEAGAAVRVGPAHRDGAGAALAFGAAFLGAGQAARPQPLQQGDAGRRPGPRRTGRPFSTKATAMAKYTGGTERYNRARRYNRAPTNTGSAAGRRARPELRVIRGISSRRVVRPDGVSPGTVLFAGERIEAVVPERVACPTSIDVGDLRRRRPGWSTAHVHVNEPGRTDWEGFATATRAAAAGGVTTIVDMPLNASPVTTTPRRARREARGQRTASAPSTSASGPASCRATPPISIDLARAGVLGGKAFLVPSGIDEFPATSASASCARRCRCCAITGCRCWRTPSSISGAAGAAGRSAHLRRLSRVAAARPGKTRRSPC